MVLRHTPPVLVPTALLQFQFAAVAVLCVWQC